MIWFKWLQIFADTIFPDICLACSNELMNGEKEICSKCVGILPYTNHSDEVENIFWQRVASIVPIRYALAYLKFEKENVTQQIVHHLKYYENQEIGKMLGRWYGGDLKKKEKYHFDYLLPVPLHKSKLAHRGYNQSDCFAEGLAEQLNTQWSPYLLKRNKATETQTRKSREERIENVKDIFEVTNREVLRGKHVAIIDDVATTGATLASCFKEVEKCEPASISFITLAIAGEI